MKGKMMICPKAKECKYPLYCGAREPHQKDVACGLKSKMAENPWKCPACVKVEPQQEARRIEILNKPGALNISEVRILHEHEQTPMVEALQTAKTEIAFMLKYIEELQENIRKLNANRMPIVSKSLRQIDAVLEGK